MLVSGSAVSDQRIVASLTISSPGQVVPSGVLLSSRVSLLSIDSGTYRDSSARVLWFLFTARLFAGGRRQADGTSGNRGGFFGGRVAKTTLQRGFGIFYTRWVLNVVSPGDGDEGMEAAIVDEGSEVARFPGYVILTGGWLRDVVVIALAGLLRVEVITGGHSRSFDETLVHLSRMYFPSSVSLGSANRERGGTVSRTSAGPRTCGGGATGGVTVVTPVMKTIAIAPSGGSTGQRGCRSKSGRSNFDWASDSLGWGNGSSIELLSRPYYYYKTIYTSAYYQSATYTYNACPMPNYYRMLHKIDVSVLSTGVSAVIHFVPF